MKRNYIIPLLLLLAFTSIGRSQEESKVNKEVNVLAEQYAELSAYLEILTDGIKESGDMVLHEQYEKLENDCMLYSLILATDDRDKELAAKLTHSRIEIFKKEMLKEIQNDRANIAILMNKHQENLIKMIDEKPPLLIEIINKLSTSEE